MKSEIEAVEDGDASTVQACQLGPLKGSCVWGQTWGRARRSEERMKKWPWKALMRRPLLQRMRMTASQAVGRARLCRTSCPSFTCPRT